MKGRVPLEHSYYKNPFNYCGAKYKLLPQILPLFPQEIDTFVDLFGGSGEVSFNVSAREIIYNDKSSIVPDILQHLDNDFVWEVESNCLLWELNKENKSNYLDLREAWNQFYDKDTFDRQKAVDAYCLLAHSFNNQIGVNRNKEFNVPFGTGRSSFNDSMKNNLINYVNRKKELNISFFKRDFRDIDIDIYKGRNAFFYADPPYLITTGGYERDYYCKWSEANEIALYNYLDAVNDAGLKFALSNVLTHKGKKNFILEEWSRKYKVHYLNKSYASCNYQTHNATDKSSTEVLVTNY